MPILLLLGLCYQQQGLAVVYTFPGNAVAPQDLITGDSLIVNAPFQAGAGQYTVSMQGGTTTTNNSTIQAPLIAGAFAITTVEAPFNAGLVTITNNNPAAVIVSNANFHAISVLALNTQINNTSGTIQGISFAGNNAPNETTQTINNLGIITSNGAPLGSIIVNSTLGRITINNSGVIQAAGAISAIRVLSDGLFTTTTINNNNGGVINGNIVNASGAATSNYNLNIAAGSILNGNFQTQLVSNDIINVNGNYALLGNFINARTINILNDNTTLTVGAGLSIEGFAEFNVDPQTTLLLNGAGAQVTSRDDGILLNSGTVTVSNGTLDSDNIINDNGAIVTSNGTGVINAGTFTNNGTVTSSAGGSVSATTLDNAAIFTAGGAGAHNITTLNNLVGGTVSVTNNINATTINNSGTLSATVAGALTGTTINNSGTLTTAGTSTLTSTTFNNTGTFTAGSTGAQNITTLNNNGGIVNHNLGTTITGNVNNSGTYNQNGNIVGAFVNNGSHILTPAIAPRNITGNYTQNAGGNFLPYLISTANYGRINVGGNTNLNGTVEIVLPNDGANINYNDTFDLITSAGPLTYNANLTWPASSPYYFVIDRSVIANILRVRAVNPILEPNVTAGPMFIELLRALQQIQRTRPPGSFDFLNTINTQILQGNTEGILAELSPNVYQALNLSVISMQQLVFDKIAARLDMLRHGVDNFRRGYAAGDLAGGCLSYGPFFFGNGIQQNDADQFYGYKSSTTGLGWAADQSYDLGCGRQGRFGAAIALSYLLTTPQGIFEQLDNSTKAWSLQPMVYGTFEEGNAFVDGILGLALNRYSSHRNLPHFAATASAKFNGYQLGGKARAGYVMPFARIGVMPVATLEFTPMVGLQYLRLTQQQYDETGAGVANLSVLGQHISNYQFSAGGRLAAVNEPRGFYTELHAMMLVDFKRTPLQVTANFVSFGPLFSMPGLAPSKTGVNVGGSSSISFADSFLFTAGLDFEARRNNYLSYTGWLRIRWLFG